MSDTMEKLVTLGVLVPGELAVVYPGVDAWVQLDQGGAVAPSGDPAWASIEHYAVTPAGTPKVVSAFAQAKVSTAQFKFGSASALFDGVGDYLFSPDHADFAVGAADFTAEGWVRFSDKTKAAMLLSQWDAGANQMSWGILWNGSGQISLTTSVNGSTNVPLGNWTWNPNNNQWYHVAFVRYTDFAMLAVDGVFFTPADVTGKTLFNSTAPLTIGGRSDLTTNTLAGWMDEIRLSVGIARWNSNFSIPTAPYATDQYTKLLLHCEGADASTTFTDDSPLPPTGVDPGADPAWCQLEH